MFTLKDQKNINSRIALLIIFLSFLLLAEPVLAKKEGRRGNKAKRNEVKNTRVSKSAAGNRKHRSGNFAKARKSGFNIRLNSKKDRTGKSIKIHHLWIT